MRVLFKTDASAEKKAGKTPATEVDEASAPFLAVCELQPTKASAPVQTIVPLLLRAHQYPTMKARTQHSPVNTHTHTRNPPGLHERTLSEMRKKQRIISKIDIINCVLSSGPFLVFFIFRPSHKFSAPNKLSYDEAV